MNIDHTVVKRIHTHAGRTPPAVKTFIKISLVHSAMIRNPHIFIRQETAMAWNHLKLNFKKFSHTAKVSGFYSLKTV